MSFPYHDRFWRDAADFLEARAARRDLILAPDIFWWRFRKIYRYINTRLCPDFEYDWVVLHKGFIDELPALFIIQAFSALTPLFANEVFVILGRGGPEEAVVAGDPHLVSLTERLPHLDEIIGFIDQPAQGSKPFDVGSIEITGWAASKLGIENIEIDCDGTLLGIAFYGLLRPEIAIAFPDFKDAGRSGFFWMLDATRLAAGRHVVRVVARSHSGQWKEWTRDFSLGSTTSYQEWLTKNTLDSEKKKLLITRAKQLKTKPAITILIVCKSIVDRDAISRSLASLADQLYQNFKVIITAAKAEIDCIQTAVDTGAIAGRIHLVPSDQPHWAEGLL